MTDLSGQSFGRYNLLERLGVGGMATVYKAFDTRLETHVAVKVIRTETLAPTVLERALKRFEREAKALARLTHPNIVKVTDYGEHDGKPYLVMTYLPGGTLKQRLGKPIPWQAAARTLLPIARALDYAHRQNMIHRDVKPANILFTADGEPMLTDFGIAKVLNLEETTDLTGTGMGIGTPEYMAPEQWTGETTQQSDQYSLGVVFYEMMTARKPYIANTPAAILLKQANEPLPRPSQFARDLPNKVEKILLKALAKSPAERYPSMGAFAGTLENSVISDQSAVISRQSLEISERSSTIGRKEEAKQTPKRETAKTVAAPVAVDQAERAAQRAAELRDILRRAQQAAQAGRWDEAIEALNTGLASDPENKTLQAKLAEVRKAQSEARLKAALRFADTAAHAGKWEEAAAALNEALAVEPGNAEVQKKLSEVRAQERSSKLKAARTQARSLARAERFDESLRAWADYMKLSPNDREAALAEAESVRKAQTLARNYAEAHKAYSKKNYEKAIGLFKPIVVENADYKDASRLLAESVELRRTARKWWQSRWVWGGVGIVVLVSIAYFVFRFGLPMLASTPTPTRTPTGISETGVPFTPIPATATFTPSPTVTATTIPLVWRSVSMGLEFERDGITRIVQDRQDKDLIYVLTRHAGVYKTIDGGASWQSATEAMPAEENTNSSNPGLRLPGQCSILAVNPQNSNLAYCGIEKGIYRTNDAGQDWELNNPKVGLVKTIVISPHDPQIIFAGGQGFSISEDSGQTWEQFNNGIPNIPVELNLYPKDSSNLFAQEMTSSGSPIFRSTNRGLSWNLLRTDSCNLLFDVEGNPTCGFWKSYNGGTTWINIFYSKILGYAISGYPSTIGANYPYSSTSLVFFPGANPKYYVTHDLGKTWESLPESYGWGYGLRFFFDQENGQVIYAFEIQETATPVLYRSNDFGETWTSCSSLSEGSGSDTGTPLAVDYDDSNHLLVASQGEGILVSKDGCQSWTESNSGLTNLYVNTIAADPNNPNLFYAGTGGGAYVSFDGGQTWGQINDGLLGATVVYSIVVDKDSNVYAATPFGIFKLESR